MNVHLQTIRYAYRGIMSKQILNIFTKIHKLQTKIVCTETQMSIYTVYIVMFTPVFVCFFP